MWNCCQFIGCCVVFDCQMVEERKDQGVDGGVCVVEVQCLVEMMGQFVGDVVGMLGGFQVCGVVVVIGVEGGQYQVLQVD